MCISKLSSVETGKNTAAFDFISTLRKDFHDVKIIIKIIKAQSEIQYQHVGCTVNHDV